MRCPSVSGHDGHIRGGEVGNLPGAGQNGWSAVRLWCGIRSRRGRAPLGAAELPRAHEPIQPVGHDAGIVVLGALERANAEVNRMDEPVSAARNVGQPPRMTMRRILSVILMVIAVPLGIGGGVGCLLLLAGFIGIFRLAWDSPVVFFVTAVLMVSSISLVILSSALTKDPLLRAAERGDVEGVRALLARAVGVDLRDGYGGTPLARAAERGHGPVVDLLLKAGADPNVIDSISMTPLMAAAYRGHCTVVELLLAHGADVNKMAPVMPWTQPSVSCYPSAAYRQTFFERTPLMVAVDRGHLEIAKLLLSHGADKGLRGEGGCTASDLARDAKMLELLQ